MPRVAPVPGDISPSHEPLVSYSLDNSLRRFFSHCSTITQWTLHSASVRRRQPRLWLASPSDSSMFVAGIERSSTSGYNNTAFLFIRCFLPRPDPTVCHPFIALIFNNAVICVAFSVKFSSISSCDVLQTPHDGNISRLWAHQNSPARYRLQ